MATGGSWPVKNPGKSHYPVEAGYVLKRTKSVQLFNKFTGLTEPHWCYYWVMKIWGWDGHIRKHQDRKVRVYTICVPTIEGKVPKKNLTRSKPIRFRSLIKYLSSGYEIVSSDCQFSGHRHDYGKFWKIVEGDLGRSIRRPARIV